MLRGRLFRIANMVVVVAFVTALAPGCATTSKSLIDPMQIGALALAAGAGYVGYNETRDESRDTQMATTALAAGATYLVAQYLAGQVDSDKVKEFNAGYSLGTSNAAKTQYWIIQNRQRWDAKSANKINFKYYSLPGSLYDPSGVKLAPHDVVVRVVK